MQSGTKPLLRLPKTQFHTVFGSTAPDNIPDFNVDAGIWMPDQNVLGAPTECTGFTGADILTDITKVLQDPDFIYAAALYLEGEGPTTGGADFHIALQGLVAVGSIAQAAIPLGFSAVQMGELYVANWNNWPAAIKALALKNVQNGTLNLLGNGDPFDSIMSAVYTSKIAGSLGSIWYDEWDNIGPDGILPMPSNLEGFTYSPWHNYAAKGKKTINTTKYIPLKSWQGPSYGDKGWCYMSREVANAVFAVAGTGAIGLNPNAMRWASIIGILCERFPILLTDLPTLLRA